MFWWLERAGIEMKYNAGRTLDFYYILSSLLQYYVYIVIRVVVPPLEIYLLE